MARRYIVTGPPGAGKTTLMNEMRHAVSCVDEPARRVIAAHRTEQRAQIGGQDPPQFIADMLALTIGDYTQTALHEGPVVFDRGLPDLIAYAAYYGVSDGAVQQAARAMRYETQVFWCPAWPAIYRTDADRTLGFDEASAFGERIATAYRTAGYTLINIPFGTVSQRAEFVRQLVRA